MSRRVRINFETINGRNFSIIDPKLISESNKRIKDRMRKIKIKNNIL